MSKNDYGFFDRLLHHFALRSTHIQQMSFTIDQMLNRTDYEEVREKSHVFVSGLARAGTTAIMRLFYATSRYCSLTYRDMPFPLSPHLWHNIQGTSSKEGVMRERAHGDGLTVDYDSPEALEEIFWRVFCNRQYILSDRLVPMEAEAETIEYFQQYIAAVLEVNLADRYLSKNNNNILRLASIHAAFPNAVIIIPYRDPFQQSLSLYRQHCRFIQAHRENNFAKNYMKWLVHHEFGSDHRFFDVGNGQSARTPDEPGYWLDQWVNVYRFLLNETRDKKLNTIFVEYEELCDKPDMVWGALAKNAALDEDTLPAGFILSQAPDREWKCKSDDPIQEAKDVLARLKRSRIHSDDE
jgi:hypothetical protein